MECPHCLDSFDYVWTPWYRENGGVSESVVLPSSAAAPQQSGWDEVRQLPRDASVLIDRSDSE